MYYALKKRLGLVDQDIDIQTYPNLRDILCLASKQPLSLVQNYSLEITVEWMADNERSRKVISRSNLRMTHKYPSKKNKRMIYCESKHEWNTMIVLDACSEVVSYQEQPAIIRYLDYDNQQRTHYPDVLVILRNKHRILLEIKDESEINDSFINWRTNHLAECLKDLGITYLLVSSSQVSGCVKKLSEDLLKNASKDISENDKENIRRRFASQVIPFNQAVAIAGDYSDQSLGLICGLIVSGELELHGTVLGEKSTLCWRDF